MIGQVSPNLVGGRPIEEREEEEDDCKGGGGGRELERGFRKIGKRKFRQEQEGERKAKKFVSSIFSLRSLLMYLRNIVPAYIKA